MARPSEVKIDSGALLHNLEQVKRCAPHSKIIAMLKADAYGCGLKTIAPILEGRVAAFGVACLEEAMLIRSLGLKNDCILFQGIFSGDELETVAAHRLQCVIHQAHQLKWLLATPLSTKIRVWVKVNTGMHRLGFSPAEVQDVIVALKECAWVENRIGLLTHFACADELDHPANQMQLKTYKQLPLPEGNYIRSISNSAAILTMPETHMDMVRPGIMLYGISPFKNRIGKEFNLKPVVHFLSEITAIHHYPADVHVGYGATWKTKRPSTIGIIACGYGDGYPRHIAANTFVWIKGNLIPIIGRVSMDMLTVDLTDFPEINLGACVELWGANLPLETVAAASNTLTNELLCQLTTRPKRGNKLEDGSE